MEDKIFDIVTDLIRDDISKEEAIDAILLAHDSKLSQFQKNKLDILNWAKSELKNETNPKLGKTMSAYRTDKILFLNRIVKWIDNKEIKRK